MLTTAFLGWFCAGFLLSATSVALQPAVVDLLSKSSELNLVRFNDLSARAKLKPGTTSHLRPLSERDKADLLEANILVGKWVAWLKCSFLFGAAFGGLCFGAVGDHLGRTKGMGLAILTYSLMALLASFSRLPVQLLVCWFFACMGVGGMWPNGVALVAEAWSSLSRTASSGIIGAAANMGIYFISTIMMAFPPVPSSLGASVSKVFQSLPSVPAMFLPGKVTPVPTDWQWVMLFAALPAVLGVFSLVAVPESPLWLANRGKAQTANKGVAGPGEIFQPPYLAITLVGIILATIPLIGGWGSADWIVQWADRVGDVNPSLKADVNRTRAFTGIAGALAGGWLASVLGRKMTFFPEQSRLAAVCSVSVLVRRPDRPVFPVVCQRAGPVYRCLLWLAPLLPA
jgi:MFS family permease